MDAQVWFEYCQRRIRRVFERYNYISCQPGRTRDVNETFCGDTSGTWIPEHSKAACSISPPFFGEICDTLMF